MYTSSGCTYTFEIDKNGKYELTTVSDQAANDTLSGKSPAVASGIYGNASTVYIVMNWTSGTASDYDRRTGTSEADYEYFKLSTPTIITGYANVGELDNVVGAYVDESDPAGVAEVVFIYTNGTAGANADYIYYLGTYTQTSDGFVYDVIVDGVKTTMTDDEIDTGITTSTGKGLMTLSSGEAAPVSTSSKYKDGAALYCTASTEYTLKNQGGLLYAKSSAVDTNADLNTTSKYICTVGDAVPVYTVSAADGSVNVGTAADLSNEVTANQVALVANSTDDGVAAIWLIVD